MHVRRWTKLIEGRSPNISERSKEQFAGQWMNFSSTFVALTSNSSCRQGERRRHLEEFCQRNENVREQNLQHQRREKTVLCGTPSLGCTRCLSSLAFSEFHAKRDGQSSRLFISVASANLGRCGDGRERFAPWWRLSILVFRLVL